MGREIELINSFLLDEDVEKASNWLKTVSVFDICKINEINHSSIIAWLLNPAESHNIGDLFIKKMLKTILQTYAETKSSSPKKYSILSKNKFFKNRNQLNIDQGSFINVFVEKEFKASKGTGKTDKVDICILDYDNNLLIIIENKHGSRETGKINNYYKYIEKVYAKFKYKIYIYLDINERFDVIDNKWICLGYDWIVQFCENILEDMSISPVVENIVRDYYDLVSGEYSVGFYNGITDLFPYLRDKHKDLIKHIETRDIKNIPIKSLSHENIIKSNIRANAINRKLLFLYWKYKNIFDELIEYNQFDLIEAEITAKLPNSNIEYSSARRKLFIFDENWYDYSKDQDDWPIYILYNRGSEDGAPPKLRIVIKKSAIKEGFTSTFENISHQFNRKLDSKHIRFDKTIFDKRNDPKAVIKAAIKKIEKVNNIIKDQ